MDRAWKIVVMVGTTAGAVLYATTWVDSRIVAGQKAAQDAIVKTLAADLANVQAAIVTDVGERIGEAEQNLRAEIKNVDGRLYAHVSGHPTPPTQGADQLLGFLLGELGLDGRRVVLERPPYRQVPQ